MILNQWARSLLVDPVTKLSKSHDDFDKINGLLDARIFLSNSPGYNEWEHGQDEYESWEIDSKAYNNQVSNYLEEIIYDKPVYENFILKGSILDVGGGAGTLRQMLPDDLNYICVDPFVSVLDNVPQAKRKAYDCLSKNFNFIYSCAEFLPFKSQSFDWVHMRSMLDHVQIPDLALLEAHRVLNYKGKLLVGLSIEGGPDGVLSIKEQLKELVRSMLVFAGFTKFKDHHTWHPTYSNLIKLIESNGFMIESVYWQPKWIDKVVYVCATKK